MHTTDSSRPSRLRWAPCHPAAPPSHETNTPSFTTYISPPPPSHAFCYCAAGVVDRSFCQRPPHSQPAPSHTRCLLPHCRAHQVCLQILHWWSSIANMEGLLSGLKLSRSSPPPFLPGQPHLQWGSGHIARVRANVLHFTTLYMCTILICNQGHIIYTFPTSFLWTGHALLRRQ